MRCVNVLMVRIYLTESDKLMKTITHYLKNEAKVRGMTIFRAVSGFGTGGEHTSSWIDISLDLPITIEFFDEEAIVNPALDYLAQIVKPEHMVCWEANANIK